MIMSDLTRLKQDAVDIFLAGVAAVDPREAVIRHLSLNGDVLQAGDARVPLSPEGRIFVVGCGKGGAPMAAAVEEILGKRLYEGLVVVKYGHLAPLKKVRLLEAAHPVPDEAGLAASREMRGLLGTTRPEDVVVCLLSGGGSALLPSPVDPVSLSDKQAVTRLLLGAGADIGEINCVRKHLSQLKGGGLARAAHPARVVTLILSDVVGDPLEVISSGPTVGDPTYFSDALGVLEKFSLLGEVPRSVRFYLQDGAKGLYPETPKPDDPIFKTVTNVLVGTNSMAIEAAAAKAGDLGFATRILSSDITGDTRAAVELHLKTVREIVAGASPPRPPACVLSGGETTVVLRGKGKGGRNQEFALAAANGIKGLERVVILSGGTDGTDGPTDAAGAIADGTTVLRAEKAGMDPEAFLADNDSYHFFEKLGDLLVTGPTLTNVMDLRVMLVGGESREGRR